MNTSTTNPQHTVDEDEIDLKEVFNTLNRYKYSILVFSIVFTIGAVLFAYFTPNVYEAETTIELKQETKGWDGGNSDAMAQALGGNSANLSDFFVRGDLLRILLQVFNHRFDRKIDAALEIHWVHTGGYRLGTFPYDRVRKNRGGRGAVTGEVG